ncbi:MAG TPA: serine hydrolase [Spirochaetota bacterium]|nr:serine hydrolase [Spirochaetota bacterium]
MSDNVKTKKISMKVFAVVGAVLLILTVAGILNFNRTQRLYRVVTLFDHDVIVENFRTMGERFEARTVHHGEAVSPLKSATVDLPDTYIHRGEKKSVAEFIDRTWTTGFIVLRGGTILFERYYRGNTAASRTISWSAVKSLVSALMGIAVAEGYIKDIRQPVTDYVPSLGVSGYNGVPIKDVLQMSSGVRFDETYADFNSDINRMGRYFALNMPFEEFILSLESERKPGVYNHYVSMDTQVLGMVIRSATGKSLSAYAEEKLWKPLGMESDAFWLIDSDGAEAAFCGLNAVLRDYARFGRLYLNRGNWDGRQIVPAEWVRASVTPDAPHLAPGRRDSSSWVLGYGYQWWIPENPDGDFLAIGIYGQAIYVYPKYGIVIAKSSAYPDYNTDGEDMEIESIEMFRSIARNIGR